MNMHPKLISPKPCEITKNFHSFKVSFRFQTGNQKDSVSKPLIFSLKIFELRLKTLCIQPRKAF